MEKNKIIIGVIVLAVVIVGMFGYTYLKKKEIETNVEAPQEDIQVAGPYEYIDRIEAKHFFDGTTHTLVGEVLMPTPCDLLNWDVLVAESFPEQVMVRFDVLNNADVCVQVIAPQRFKVSFDASEQASIRATLEGRDVDLNLIPAGEGETPDDFELFIKG